MFRPYYHCRHCHRGHVPWDSELGITSQALSPAAAEVVAMIAVSTPFEQAAKKSLPRTAGLRLSESTVQRTTEAAGQRLIQLRHNRISLLPKQHWDWSRDAAGRTCAYVSVDATGVRQQGPGGKKAEGRMATVGMIYSPRMSENEKRPPPHRVRYLAGLYHLDELGLELRREAADVGWDEAEQQIALSDGGAGLEDFFHKNFPRAECILDFWHANEHLVELAAAWFDDEAERERWVDQQAHRLKHEGGQAVLDVLEAMPLGSRSATAREAHRQHIGYFRNHVHRMDYPRYCAQGWQIGSGPVESACGTVVGDRLKGAGMRWGEDGTDAVCHLRALYLSQSALWAAFWRDHPN